MSKVRQQAVLRLKRKRGVESSDALELEVRREGDVLGHDGKRRKGRNGDGMSVLSFLKVETVDESVLNVLPEGIRYIDVVPLQEFTCNGVEMVREEEGEQSGDVVYDLYVESVELGDQAVERVRLEDPSMETYFLTEEDDEESLADGTDSEGTVDYPSTPEDYADDNSAESYRDTAYDSECEPSLRPDCRLMQVRGNLVPNFLLRPSYCKP